MPTRFDEQTPINANTPCCGLMCLMLPGIVWPQKDPLNCTKQITTTNFVQFVELSIIWCRQDGKKPPWMQRNITLHPFWCTQIQLARQLNNNYSIRINSFIFLQHIQAPSKGAESLPQNRCKQVKRIEDFILHVQRQWTPFLEQSCVSSSTNLIHSWVGQYHQHPHKVYEDQHLPRIFPLCCSSRRAWPRGPQSPHKPWGLYNLIFVSNLGATWSCSNEWFCFFLRIISIPSSSRHLKH